MNQPEYVYIIKNADTGRVYVGSSFYPEWRIKVHMNALKKHRHSVLIMQSDFDLYGFDSFKSVVFGKYDRAEANRMEVFLMKMFKSQNPEFGYNYKDQSGNGLIAIASKWRIPCTYWETGIGESRLKRDFPDLYTQIILRKGISKECDRPNAKDSKMWEIAN